jgi:hypothetical protein
MINIDMEKLHTQTNIKFVQQAQKSMFFECPTQESIPYFLLPTKWTKIFEKSPKNGGGMIP